jgi:hypothetical protein
MSTMTTIFSTREHLKINLNIGPSLVLHAVRYDVFLSDGLHRALPLRLVHKQMSLARRPAARHDGRVVVHFVSLLLQPYFQH